MNTSVETSPRTRWRNRVLSLNFCRLAGTSALVISAVVLGHVLADEPSSIEVMIRNHRFTPSEIHVPVGKVVALDIRNEDASAEDFDVRRLGLESIIAGNGSGIVWLRELKQGRYPFFGDYHSGTANGVVVAE